MSFVTPQVADFKAQFPLDFPYGEGPESVSDEEIQAALNLTAGGSYFNPALFNIKPLGAGNPPVSPTTTEASMAFLFCSAHFLYLAVKRRGGLRAPGFKGGMRSSAQGVTTGQTVGPVSVQREWPDSVKNDPMLFTFTQSAYGEQYLQMLTPKLVGNVGLVGGERLPTGFGI